MDDNEQSEILINQYQTHLSKNSLSYPWNIQTTSIIQTPPIVLAMLHTPKHTPKRILKHDYIPHYIPNSTGLKIPENDWVLIKK